MKTKIRLLSILLSLTALLCACNGGGTNAEMDRETSNPDTSESEEHGKRWEYMALR